MYLHYSKSDVLQYSSGKSALVQHIIRKNQLVVQTKKLLDIVYSLIAKYLY